MYTILVTQENELITSVKERIMKRSKMVDKLHFLVLEPNRKKEKAHARKHVLFGAPERTRTVDLQRDRLAC